jgi:heme exporter protein C
MTENKTLYALTAGALAAMAAAAWMIFFYAPPDALEGVVQKILYLHVGTALAAFGCFGLVLVGGVAYLWKESMRGDRLARAGAIVGLVFTTNTFVMGMIWAKPIWNWDPSQTWDARITSTAVLWVIYAGYLLVRRFATPGRPAMRLAAVVGIVGFADVPIVYFSVQWWRTLHPGPVLVTANGPQLPPEMLWTMVVTSLAVLLLAGALLAIRYRIEARRDALEERIVAAQLELSSSSAR